MEITINGENIPQFQGALEPLNIMYAHPLVVMGKTYPDALRAYLARANERSLDDYPLPDWQAYLDVHRAKFHDPELRPALLSAGYDDLWAWTEFGRSLMVVRDELLLEDMDSTDEAWEAAVPSREMRDYWKAKSLKGIQLFEVIASAPIALEKKVELLKKVAPTLAVEGQRALDDLELKAGEVFRVIEYGDSLGMPRAFRHDERAFTNSEMAWEYIKRRFAPGKDKMEKRKAFQHCWAELGKWVPDKDGHLVLSRIYTLMGKDVAYVHDVCAAITTPSSSDWRGYRGPSFEDPGYLSLPVPFRPGDCVRLDCRPFVPAVKDGIILDITTEAEVYALPPDNDLGEAVAFIYCLCFEDSKWHIVDDYEFSLILSPRYRMETVEATGTMRKVQEFVQEDADHGIFLMQQFDRDIDISFSTEELLKLIDQQKEKEARHK